MSIDLKRSQSLKNYGERDTVHVHKSEESETLSKKKEKKKKKGEKREEKEKRTTLYLNVFHQQQ